MVVWLVVVGIVAVGLAVTWRWSLRSRLERAASTDEGGPDAAERARTAREIGRQVDAGRDAGYRATSNLPPSL